MSPGIGAGVGLPFVHLQRRGGSVTSWFTDFADETVGQAPSGWTSRFTALETFSIVDDGGTKILRVGNTGGGLGETLVSWDLPTQAENVEVVAKVRYSSQVIQGSTARHLMPLWIQASGSGGSEAGYTARLQNATPDLQGTMYKYAAGAPGVIGSALHTVSASTFTDQDWNWFRLRKDGPVITYRVWPDGEAEPETWEDSYSDASPIASGWVGFGASYLYGTFDCGAFGVATNGAAAPTS